MWEEVTKNFSLSESEQKILESGLQLTFLFRWTEEPVPKIGFEWTVGGVVAKKGVLLNIVVLLPSQPYVAHTHLLKIFKFSTNWSVLNLLKVIP